MKKLSIKAIAETLQISTATVSYILNGKSKEKRISDELTQKVLAFVEKTNFKPNHLAKSLRTGKTNVIGLMVEDIADTFFSSIAGSIENIAYENGYKIIYSSTKNSPQKAKELITTFRERNVDGYIITPTESIEDDIRDLMQSNLPVVLFDRQCKDVEASYVGMNNFESAYKAVDYLFAQGYRHIGLVTLDSAQAQMIDRLLGYQRAVFEHRRDTLMIKFDYLTAKTTDITNEIEQFLRKHPQLDALFFATNYLAISGIEVLSRLKTSIGGEFGIVVFDDNDLFRIHQPTISAIAQPVHEMAQQLILTLLDHMNRRAEDYLPQKHVLRATLIKRLSSQKQSPSKV